MKLTMPLPPQIGNERGHWAVRHRRKTRFYRDCDLFCGAGLIPAPPAKPYAKATLSAHFHLWNLMDHDNLSARLKAALDWLVTRGYIVDDRPSCLTVVGVDQCIDRKDQRLEIELRGARP